MAEHVHRKRSISFRFKQLLSYFFPVQIEKRPGMLGSVLEVNLENGYLVLNSEKLNYSFGHLHSVFAGTFEKYRVKERKPATALILGFGAGSIAEILLDEYELNSKITGVELDTEVIALYEKYFTDDLIGDMEIIEDDAEEFVNTCKDHFDIIAIDIFVDDETPLKFSDEKFIHKTCSLLNRGGILFYNRILNTESSAAEKTKILQIMQSFPGKISEMNHLLSGIKSCVLVYEPAKK